MPCIVKIVGAPTYVDTGSRHQNGIGLSIDRTSMKMKFHLMTKGFFSWALHCVSSLYQNPWQDSIPKVPIYDRFYGKKLWVDFDFFTLIGISWLDLDNVFERSEYVDKTQRRPSSAICSLNDTDIWINLCGTYSKISIRNRHSVAFMAICGRLIFYQW